MTDRLFTSHGERRLAGLGMLVFAGLTGWARPARAQEQETARRRRHAQQRRAFPMPARGSRLRTSRKHPQAGSDCRGVGPLRVHPSTGLAMQPSADLQEGIWPFSIRTTVTVC